MWGAGRSGAGHGLSPAAVADHMGLSVVEQLLQNVCLLLGSRTRDVVKAALGFLKVVLLLVDTKLLAKHVQTMVRAQRKGWQGRAALLLLPWGPCPAPAWSRGGTALVLVAERAARGLLSQILARICPQTKQGDLPAALPAARGDAGRCRRV